MTAQLAREKIAPGLGGLRGASAAAGLQQSAQRHRSEGCAGGQSARIVDKHYRS